MTAPNTYDGQRIIEQRDGSDQVLRQMLWGMMYIDELVEVSVNQDPWNANYSFDESPQHMENECEKFFWAMHDANYNVLGLMSGYLVERYEYEPYGSRTVFSHGFLHTDLNWDGQVTGDDYAFVQVGAYPTSPADFNGDGQVTGDDDPFILGNFGRDVGVIADPLLLHPSLYSQHRIYEFDYHPGYFLGDFGHQGLLHDEETGLIYNRARMLHPRLQRFMQRDPLGYVDGANSYAYVRSNATGFVDPHGKQAKPPPNTNAHWRGTPVQVGHWTVFHAIYLGPWKCNAELLENCKTKCKKDGFDFKGCVWIADLKVDAVGLLWGRIPAAHGFRAAAYQCCCDCPKRSKEELAEARRQWDAARDEYRENWGREFGGWPTDSEGNPWPGHHIHDLLHYGDPVGEGNILPVDPEVHKIVNRAYRECYSGEGGWDEAGPVRPYTD